MLWPARRPPSAAQRLRAFAFLSLTVVGGASCVAWLGAQASIPSTDRPAGSPLARVVLVGDAGRPLEVDLDNCGGWPVESSTASCVADSGLFEQVEEEASRFPGRSLIVWLGDNVYEHGFPSNKEVTKACDTAAVDCVQRSILGRQVAVGQRAGAPALYQEITIGTRAVAMGPTDSAGRHCTSRVAQRQRRLACYQPTVAQVRYGGTCRCFGWL